MSRILVTNDDQSVWAELWCDESGDWFATSTCNHQVMDLGQSSSLRDAAEEVAVHMDNFHAGVLRGREAQQ